MTSIVMVDSHGDDAEILALKREIDRLVAAGDAIPDDDAAWPFYRQAT